MNKRSRLHLPSPPARPGEAPDFSYVQLSPAGAVPRPDVNARASDIGIAPAGVLTDKLDRLQSRARRGLYLGFE